MARQALPFCDNSSPFLTASAAGAVRLLTAAGLVGLCLAVLLAANTLPALPLSSVISLAFAPVVAAATKSALNAKRSLAGVKPSAGGQS